MRFLTRWADGIERTLRPITEVCNFTAMIALLIMVFLLTANVIGRYAFDSPVKGTEEFEEFLLVIVCYFGLAYTGLLKRHIRVDLIMSRFPEWVGHVVDTVTALMALMLWVMIAWRTFEAAIKNMDPMITSPVMHWPIFPFILIVAFGSFLLWFVLIAEIMRSLHGAITAGGKKALWIIAGIAIACGICVVALVTKLPVSMFTAGLLGIGLLLLLLFLRMPIAFAMGFVGLIGVWYFRGWVASTVVMGTTPYYTVAWYVIVVVPLFIMMGEFCFHAGLSRELYDTGYTFLGRLPGGLASATVAGCAGFAAICGESLATAATMGAVSLPEMKRFKYADSLATGCVAAGGTLGILIPPSMGFIFYAIITEQSIGELFIAGIIPGIMLASLFILSITIRARFNPTLGPPGPSTTWIQKLKALKGTWAVLVLFIVVIGGIYLGVFTPIEAGGIGAFGALLMMVIKGKFNRKNLISSLMETGRTTAMIVTIFVGVFILGYFMSTSEVPLVLADIIAGLVLNRYIILAIILIVYVILGCLMNIIPMILLTLPIFWPTIVAMDFDPIWFGVIMVIIMEMGQITPPIGMNVFAISGVAGNVPLGTIFKGIFPFVLVEMVFIVILTIFPQIATWLPGLMM